MDGFISDVPKLHCTLNCLHCELALCMIWLFLNLAVWSGLLTWLSLLQCKHSPPAKTVHWSVWSFSARKMLCRQLSAMNMYLLSVMSHCVQIKESGIPSMHTVSMVIDRSSKQPHVRFPADNAYQSLNRYIASPVGELEICTWISHILVILDGREWCQVK